MGDELVRLVKTEEAQSDELPAIFGDTPLNLVSPVSDATVAIVTTAGIYSASDSGWRGWQEHDQSFRVLKREARDLRLGHRSANFDRSGFAADINVAFPIDRLAEQAAEGEIGAVAPRHISFMGALRGNLETIRLDSGPAAAKVLRDDGVDVVLLTPV